MTTCRWCDRVILYDRTFHAWYDEQSYGNCAQQDRIVIAPWWVDGLLRRHEPVDGGT